MQSISLKSIAEKISAKIIGDENAVITKLAPLYRAGAGELSYLTNNHYRQYLKDTKATAVIVTEEHAENCATNALIVKNPELAFARVATLFLTEKKPSLGIHPTAQIAESAKIHSTASIGAYCVVGENSVIGERTTLLSHAAVSHDVKIGNDCFLHSHVTLYHAVVIGNRVTLHSGCVIGADGFGLAHDRDHFEKIPQLGSVQLHDDVEIGANTCIDRGALDDTIIETGVKIDNQVQIGHNVVIGAHTAIAGCVGIAGSTRIGRHCMIGGATAISGHLTICDGVVFTGMSMVTKSISTPDVYSSGTGLLPNKEWRKCAVKFRSWRKK